MTAARHEAGHAAALYLLDLGAVLQPGGVAVDATGAGIIALGCPTGTVDAAARLRITDCASTAPCSPVVEAARRRPELVSALLTFICAGYATEAATWRTAGWSAVVAVRTSSDLATARQILMDMLPDAGWTATNFASEAAADVLDRAEVWAARPEVRRLVDAAAELLAANGSATWTELQTLFSGLKPAAACDSAATGTGTLGAAALAGGASGAVALARTSAAAETYCAQQNNPMEDAENAPE